MMEESRRKNEAEKSQDASDEKVPRQSNAGKNRPAFVNVQKASEKVGAAVSAPGLDDSGDKIWYLGIDFGTTGISAALLNRKSGEVYPLYWIEMEGSESGKTPDRTFRLPAIAIRSTASGKWSVAGSKEQLSGDPSELFLRDFKPDLKIGIAGTNVGLDALSKPPSEPWEPILQWSDKQQIPLSWIAVALVALLAMINPMKSEKRASQENWRSLIQNSTSKFYCGALGLETETFHSALRQLGGAIVSRPASWPDSYDFNLREAILAVGLVERAEQIVVVEEAIASVLSAISPPGGKTLALPSSLSQQLNFFNADWKGLTLAISAGAATTELALVNLPEKIEKLTHAHFALHSFSYGGNALDQDIVCQLLLNEEWRAQNGEFFLNYPFSLLNFEEFPRAGEPDLERRYRLQQLLRAVSRELGLMEAVEYLKMSLQTQDRLTLALGSNRWTCTRRDLESRVFVPFVQRLNRELNVLLSKTGVQVQGIDRAICTGGTASMGAVARWLRQKLPNATIIQDAYPIDRPSACSRVAYGLAAVPFHSAVFDVHRQQYSDYFLLVEILRSLPNKPLSVGEIMRLLDRQGINTSACRERILQLLEGRLPAGLKPNESDALLLSSEYQQNLDYIGLHATPLFSKQDDGTYNPNPQQFNRLRRYFSQLLARTYQKLEDPLTINLGQPTARRDRSRL